MRQAIMFVNGEFAPPPELDRLLASDAYIIAVDGGIRHAARLAVIPHVVIGDFDSITPDDMAYIKRNDITMRRFPSRKDETDLELALQYARDQGFTDIALLGAAGGRLDHSLANLLLLAHAEFRNLHIRLLDGRQTSFLIRESASIEGEPGDLVSVVPLGGDAVGVSNEGLEWPLHNDTLPCGSPRGISNVLCGPRAVIRVRRGMLLCTVTHHPDASTPTASAPESSLSCPPSSQERAIPSM